MIWAWTSKRRYRSTSQQCKSWIYMKRQTICWRGFLTHYHCNRCWTYQRIWDDIGYVGFLQAVWVPGEMEVIVVEVNDASALEDIYDLFNSCNYFACWKSFSPMLVCFHSCRLFFDLIWGVPLLAARRSRVDKCLWWTWSQFQIKSGDLAVVFICLKCSKVFLPKDWGWQSYDKWCLLTNHNPNPFVAAINFVNGCQPLAWSLIAAKVGESRQWFAASSASSILCVQCQATDVASGCCPSMGKWYAVGDGSEALHPCNQTGWC